MAIKLEGVNQGPFGSMVRNEFGIDNSSPAALFGEAGRSALHNVLTQYRNAGATIGGAPTFRMTDHRAGGKQNGFWEFKPGQHFELSDEMAGYNAQAVSIARGVYGQLPVVGLVAPITDTSGGDDGTWEDIPEPQRVDWVMQRQRPQIEALIHAGVDAIWAEAVRYQVEAIALARLTRGMASPALVVNFEANEHGFPDPHYSGSYSFTNMRRDLQAELGNGSTVMVGANCTGVTHVRSILERGDTPDVVYPNSLNFAGLNNTEKEIYAKLAESEKTALASQLLAIMDDHLATRPETFEEIWKQCLDAGARVIGICCGGTPELVRRAKAVYEAHKA